MEQGSELSTTERLRELRRAARRQRRRLQKLSREEEAHGVPRIFEMLKRLHAELREVGEIAKQAETAVADQVRSAG